MYNSGNLLWNLFLNTQKYIQTLIHLPASPLHPIPNHSIDKLHMPIRIRLTPFSIIIQPIRPNMAPPTVDHRTGAIPAPQQRQRRPPVPRRALGIESVSLANAQGVADFVHGGALVHVGSVGAEAEVAVKAKNSIRNCTTGKSLRVCLLGFSGGHARYIGDADVLSSGAEAVVARDGEAHGGFDFGVGIALVGAGVGYFGKGPCECALHTGCAGQDGEEDRELHGWTCVGTRGEGTGYEAVVMGIALCIQELHLYTLYACPSSHIGVDMPCQTYYRGTRLPQMETHPCEMCEPIWGQAQHDSTEQRCGWCEVFRRFDLDCLGMLSSKQHACC